MKSRGKCIEIVPLAFVSLLACGTLIFATESKVNLDDLMIWGDETNSLRAGFQCPGGVLRIDARSGRLLTIEASLALSNTSSNETIRFFFPELEKRDRLVLVDSQGNVIPNIQSTQTVASARPFSSDPGMKPRMRDKIIAYRLKPGDVHTYGFSGRDVIGDLGRTFNLTNPGDYKLTRHAQILFLNTNGVYDFQTLRPVTLPPVTIKVRVEEVKP